MIIETFYIYLLLASNVVVLLIAFAAVTRFERRWERIENFWDSPTGAALDELADVEQHEQMQATQRLEQQLGELQSAVKVIDLRAPTQQPPVERKVPIDNAVRMARLGASVEDITRNCGLNIGEARLMQKLHEKAASAVIGS